MRAAGVRTGAVTVADFSLRLCQSWTGVAEYIGVRPDCTESRKEMRALCVSWEVEPLTSSGLPPPRVSNPRPSPAAGGRNQDAWDGPRTRRSMKHALVAMAANPSRIFRPSNRNPPPCVQCSVKCGGGRGAPRNRSSRYSQIGCFILRGCYGRRVRRGESARADTPPVAPEAPRLNRL
jgi:hypothetical protein